MTLEKQTLPVSMIHHKVVFTGVDNTGNTLQNLLQRHLFSYDFEFAKIFKFNIDPTESVTMTGSESIWNRAHPVSNLSDNEPTWFWNFLKLEILIPNPSDTKFIRSRTFRYRNYQIPNLSDTEPISYRTYQIPMLWISNTSDTESIRCRIYQIPKLWDTEHTGIKYRADQIMNH